MFMIGEEYCLETDTFPISSGTFISLSNDQMQTGRLWWVTILFEAPASTENNVDLYINGHDHCLQHISSLESSPIQFLTSGGGSKAWRGVMNWWKPEEMKFYYDRQGFMSLQLIQTQLHIAFYDVFGNVLHKWTTSKHIHFSTV
ncbi:hypothetical protein S83_045270 [Arachis hypogaea]